MSLEATEVRRGKYRRRLLAAAVVSLALHLLLARGLAITHFGRDGDGPESTVAAKPLTPKKKSDFQLSVPRSASAARPVHEQPLEMKVKPSRTADQATPAAAQATKNVAERRQQEPSDWVSSQQPTTQRTAVPRDVALAAPPTLPRTAEVAPAAVTTRADASAVAPAQAATATPVRPAAAAQPQNTADAIAARWRPREVELLERLTARQPEAVAALPPAMGIAGRTPRSPTDEAADGGTTQTARPLGRQGLTAAATSGGASSPIEIPVAVGNAADPTASGGPPGLPAPASRAGTMQAGSPTTALTTTARGAGSVADSTDAEPTLSSPAATAAGLSAIVGGAVAGRGAGRVAAVDTGPQATGGSPAPLARAAAVAPSASGGGAAVVTEIPTAAAAAGEPAAGGLAAVMPAAVGRVGGRFGSEGPVAAVRSRGLSAGADGEDDEELSVPAGGTSAIGRPATSRGDDGFGPAAAATLTRVATVALPAEGRVRDVAEAFARRSPARRATNRGDGVSDKTAVETGMQADLLVQRGLEFLVRSQQADGRWRLGSFAGGTAADVPALESDTAATGLALLCFLGAGHDHFEGPHRNTVRRGLEFLLAVQKPDGDLYLPADELSNSCSWLYSHGMASMALCEAVGMTGDPLVRPAAERACGFIAASQHPTLGGWRYTPRSDADLSVSGWMLVALRAGSLAGVKTESTAYDGVRTLLDAAASSTDPTRYAYNPRNPQQRPSQLSATCMTAVGSLMRLHTGWTASDPRVVEASRPLAAMIPSYGTESRKTRDSYLWYYASQVLVHTGGEPWDAWYRGLVRTLSTTQETQGPRAGSWDPLGDTPDRWGKYGGRLYVTALHLLALEVPYRHLPTYAAPGGTPAANGDR